MAAGDVNAGYCERPLLRFLDPDGNFVAGATVEYDEPAMTGKPRYFGPVRSVTTDDTGRFKLRAGAGTALRARFKGMGTESAVKTMGPGGFYNLQLAANASFELLVKIVDENGAAVPGAKLELFAHVQGFGLGGTRRAGADGTVKFDSLAVDTQWRVWADAPGYGRSAAAVPAPTHDLRRVEMTIVMYEAR